MQIEDIKVIGWLWWLVTASLGAIAFLIGFIYRNDRKKVSSNSDRITALEKQMSQAVSLQQVEHIVEKVEKEFKEDHIGLNDRLNRVEDGLKKEFNDRLTHVEDGFRKEIGETHDSLQGSINGIYYILTRRRADREDS